MPPTEPVAPAEPDLPDELPEGEPPADLVDREVEGHRFIGLDLTSRNARGVRMTDVQLENVDLSNGDLRRATLHSVTWRDGSVANARADEARLRRLRLERVRATGLRLATGHLEDVTFIDCQLDLATFRFAELDRVRFERCRMTEADFYEAAITSVVFEDCDLTRAVWSGATFRRSEMRGCDLAGSTDLERLRGVRMPWPDVIRSAHQIAQAAGIEIIDLE
jgi:uncharacterized protein YjbI with pentapeptide repeats